MCHDWLGPSGHSLLKLFVHLVKQSSVFIRVFLTLKELCQINRFNFYRRFSISFSEVRECFRWWLVRLAWNVGGSRSARVLFQARLLSAWNQLIQSSSWRFVAWKTSTVLCSSVFYYPPNELKRFLWLSEKMRVVFLCKGTRGDVAPILALAVSFKWVLEWLLTVYHLVSVSLFIILHGYLHELFSFVVSWLVASFMLGIFQ